ncbi:MAG: SsrA-binding protein [Candidatus Uhrbacteria bacterium GW2011_GWF2_41_16]|uniref:SsrA-binding protein n=2 Tax=Candidatus Uhriibacteriota TaxID=1752732 RepID=A0A0G0YE78_9BACT|nr:MAG: SsrA-binding protein [Candidatus Uhrbacteria bacterium GW2011_GWA2_41_10]KKR87622.1 MAG: SsrA-binding protein [Candidatus Uhrbacteria bacterium GW2011_GWC2_41_11]KKR98602.1 MAG: SsrA-binding protein [Candidatus Uhrbacteria bacterium GW2011_GWF2_41_16]HBO99777.1 SsrA-binding protein [Candidatus Uhrbacteria bacterium]
MSVLAINKRATYDYELLENFDGGLVLVGPEVKSAKAGHIQLTGSFLRVRDGEVWLYGAHISPYKPAGTETGLDPSRPRKVLLHRREIARLLGKTQTAGLTLVPVRVYLHRNLVKLAFALARGKRVYEKREIIKKREVDRYLRQRLKS